MIKINSIANSFSYLQNIPVNTLKIDSLFIQRIGQNKNNTEIIRSIVGLAKSLGLSVIAEGVETDKQLQELKKQFPQAEIKVESSDIRVFSDQAYNTAGIEVVEDISDCDVILGVKEVPVEALIPNTNYFFFSHTIHKQP